MIKSKLKNNGFHTRIGGSMKPFTIAGMWMLMDLLIQACEKAGVDPDHVHLRHIEDIDVVFGPAVNLCKTLTVPDGVLRFKQAGAERGEYTTFALADPEIINKLAEIFKKQTERSRSII